jgi:hypothetical protein
MRNLTLASAKHLLTQGHITPAHHQRIVAAASAPTLPKMPTMPGMGKPKKPPAGFGSLTAPPSLVPQQVQAPTPGYDSSIATPPPGLPPGY